MGIGYSNDLTLVTDLFVQFTCLSFALTMTTCDRSWKSSLFAPFGIAMYHIVVRTGAQIQDPLAFYTSPPQSEQANEILNIVEIMLMFGFSQAAWAWFRVLDMYEWFPLASKLPVLVPPRARNELVPLGEGNFTIEQRTERDAGVVRWGKRSPSWLYLLVTFLYVFGAICGAQCVYDQYILRTGGELTAYLVEILVPLGFGLLYLLYQYAYPDTYTKGYTKQVLASGKYNVSDAEAAVLQAETKNRVLWSIMPLILFQFLNSLWMCAVRAYTPNADNNSFFAYGLLGLHALLLAIVFVGGRVQRSRADAQVGSEPAIDDSGDYYTDIASPPPKPLNNNVGGGDALGAFLLGASKSDKQS